MTPCPACNRDPARVNNDHSECSVAECPHRRRCWSERPEPGYRAPENYTHPLDEHFDRQD